MSKGDKSHTTKVMKGKGKIKMLEVLETYEKEMELDEALEREIVLRKRAREDKRLKDELKRQRAIDRYFDERDEW